MKMIQFFINLMLMVSLQACTPHVPEKQSNKPATPPKKEEAFDEPPADHGYPDKRRNTNLSNLEEIKERLNLEFFHKKNYQCQNSKIAIMDNGFQGLSSEAGQSLPPHLVVQNYPGNHEAPTIHGTRMAQIVYSLCSGSADYRNDLPAPQLLLFNTNGFTNLKHAIDQVIEQGVDIVLYSQGWTFGGNFDGKGFINKEVNRALDEGIIWVNAAGNYNQTTYVSNSLESNDDGSIKLPKEGRYLNFDHLHEDIPLNVSLTWNDFTDDENYSTLQDLDLFIEDLNGNTVATSTRKQRGLPAGSRQNSEFSSHAREQISTILPAGQYRLRIQNISNNFDDSSLFRIIISTFGVTLHDATPNQTVLIPADNPNVVAVGSLDSAFSAKGFWKHESAKPDIEINSVVEFTDGTSYESTSTAAAIIAAEFAIYRTAYGRLTKEQAIGAHNFHRRYRTLKNMRLPTIRANTDTR